MSNRLATETSPYLLQHAENPVDWMPWSEAALARARQEDKPIFLSIGYAACHWCHVMAHESFEDPATAEILNRDFVAVKVDREERPDVDAVYMDAVVALSGQGGWPLSVFLTPQGEPFYGGTYFPPTPQRGMPSFRDVLSAVREAWQGERPRLIETARRLTDHLAAQSAALPAATAEGDPDIETRVMESLLRGYDWDFGGWGGAPKFPQAGTVALLLRRFHRARDPMALEMAVHCLEAMARGGIYDHLAGGFHRYAVDRNWTVPHFEKMLYDNALLARVYLEAWQATGKPWLRRVAEATLDFMRAELRTPEGGFSASLDADSEGEEGRFYAWSLAEVEAALPDPEVRELFRRTFDAPSGGNFEGRLVLRRPAIGGGPATGLPDEDDARMDDLRRRLLEARAARVRPALDDKVITAWNGLALSAWCSAARALGRPGDLDTAQTLAAFLLSALRPDGTLRRTYRAGQARHAAALDDHAALADGLLDLYQVDLDNRWLLACQELVEQVLVDFADPRGGFFDTGSQAQELPVRPKTLQDSPIPSGNALILSLLLRLEAITGESRYREAALPALAAMRPNAVRYPTAFSGWLIALGLAESPLPQLAISGAPDSQEFQALAREAWMRFLPRLTLAGGEPDAAGAPALLRGKPLLAGRPTAYLCHDFVCDRPTTSPEELGAQLDQAS